MVAQLQPIDLVAPGFQGLNTEQSQALLAPTWATVADNCVLDSSGRLSSRKGWATLTTTEITSNPTVKTIHEQVEADGTRRLIVAWDGGIADDLADPESNDISGSVTDSDGHWNFQNFIDKVIGFQDGQKPIVSTTGNFATVVESGGTAPTIADGVGLCAYGRVWGLDSDKKTIKYTVLLDETDWGNAGSGSIDLTNVWTLGTDQVTAITAFNGFLIIFGHNHIIVYEDTTGTALGFDPANMVVRDVYENTGTIGWQTVQPIGEADLLFLGRNGVQSLARIIQEKSARLTNLSENIYGEMQADLIGISNDPGKVSTVVDPSRGYYIVSFHDTVTRTWVFHYSRPYRDQQTNTVLFPVTTWDLTAHGWLWDTSNQRLLLGYAGGVGEYGNVDKDNGTAFVMDYESPWFAMDEQLANRLKIMKRLGTIVFVQSATSLTMKWDFDFGNQFRTRTITFPGSSAAEWNVAEWSEDEWSGQASLRIRKLPADGKGQYIKVGVTAEVASEIAIQQLEVFTKIGRYA